MKLNRAKYPIRCEIGDCMHVSHWYISFEGHDHSQDINACTGCLTEIAELVSKEMDKPLNLSKPSKSAKNK